MPILVRCSIFGAGERLAGKRGAMSIVRRKGSRYWYLDLERPDGTRNRESTKTADRAKAQEYHDRLRAQYWDQKRIGVKPGVLWEEAVKRYLVEIEVDGLAASTIRNYEQHLDWWGENYFGGKCLSEITKGKIMEGVYALAKECKQSTANRYLSTIRAMLNRAQLVWEVVDKVPSRFKQFDESQFERNRSLTPEEIGRVAKELPEHQRDIFEFSVATGLRQANAKLLEWSWLSMDRRVLRVPKEKFKNRDELMIPLNESAMLVLRRRLGKHKQFVFTYNGAPVEQVNTRAWRNALQRAGIADYRWHDNRHTWAHQSRRAGVGLDDLQDLGGWKDPKMTRRYATPDLEALAEKARKLDAVLATAHQRHTPDLKVVGGNASA